MCRSRVIAAADRALIQLLVLSQFLELLGHLVSNVLTKFDVQDFAQSAPAGKIVEDHLLAAGLSVASSAICWLTPAQLLAVEQELERMEMNLNFEMTAWWLSDVLMRSRVTNNRLSRAGANTW